MCVVVAESRCVQSSPTALTGPLDILASIESTDFREGFFGIFFSCVFKALYFEYLMSCATGGRESEMKVAADYEPFQWICKSTQHNIRKANLSICEKDVNTNKYINYSQIWASTKLNHKKSFPRMLLQEKSPRSPATRSTGLLWWRDEKELPSTSWARTTHITTLTELRKVFCDAELLAKASRSAQNPHTTIVSNRTGISIFNQHNFAEGGIRQLWGWLNCEIRWALQANKSGNNSNRNGCAVTSRAGFQLRHQLWSLNSNSAD